MGNTASQRILQHLLWRLLHEKTSHSSTKQGQIGPTFALLCDPSLLHFSSCFITPPILLFLLVLRYYSLCFVAPFLCIAIAWCFVVPLCFIVPLPAQIPFCPLFCYASMVVFFTSFISSLNLWSTIFRNVSKGRTCTVVLSRFVELFPNESEPLKFCLHFRHQINHSGEELKIKYPMGSSSRWCTTF